MIADKNVVRAGIGVITVVVAAAVGACGGQPFPESATKPPPTIRSSSPTSSAALRVQPVARRVLIEPVTASPMRSGVLVDPGEASEVASRLWNELVQARHYRDAGGLAKIETGPALEADLGYICLLGCRGRLLTADSVVVNVPQQQRWPLAFSANVSYTEGCEAEKPPCHDSFVVTQTSRSAPWKISHYITYAGTMFADEPATLSDGWAQSPLSNRTLSNAPAEYAAFLASLHQTGGPPDNTHLSSDWFAMNAPDTRRATLDLRTLGLGDTLTYRVDPTDPFWLFAGSNSAQFVCGTVRYSQTFTGLQHQRFIQPPDLSVLGDKVPAGIYKRVTLNGLHMACFEQHAGEDSLHVIGEWGDVTAVTANR